jgi:hypothetical protein
MAKSGFGFVQGVAPGENPRTWKKGPVTYEETIVSGVVFRYNCKVERGDSSITAPEIQSTPRLEPEEVERRFAEFVAGHTN